MTRLRVALACSACSVPIKTASERRYFRGVVVCRKHVMRDREQRLEPKIDPPSDVYLRQVMAEEAERERKRARA